MRVVIQALTVTALTTAAMLAGAPAASADPICTVNDQPDVTQEGPGQFRVDLRTQVTCFGQPVVIDD